ncbi:MAG: chloride channel protein [Polyangiaceae bacterium]
MPAGRAAPVLVRLALRVGGAAPIGALAGAAAAVFLWLLDRVTEARVAHPDLVYLLPIAGLVLGYGYERWGAPVAQGTSLAILRARDADPAAPRVPIRMAPMALAGTLITHLFGGSAGREGTAVQISASLVDGWLVQWKLDANVRRDLVAAAIAAGFGAVFGTPIAGAIFGVEVIGVVGRRSLRSARPGALLPAVIASVVGDRVARALGAVHSPYPLVHEVPFEISIAWKWLVLAAALAATTFVFIEGVERLKHLAVRFSVRLPVRLFIGGLVVVALTLVARTDAYLGLGVPSILSAFDRAPGASVFAWKLAFTVVTIGAGFIGGEVTPLFFVGATLGSALAGALGLPVGLGAAIGMATLFGAASNTPIALSVMAMELCGSGVFPHVFVVAFLAWLAKGRRSIYSAQRWAPEPETPG